MSVTVDPGLIVWVPGTPAPQGSLKAFVRGKHARIVSDNTRTMPWRATIQACLLDAGHGRELLDSPVRVALVFCLPRPKGHYGKKGLLKSAPQYPATKPDIDKLVRAALDALTGVVLWDDARVVEVDARKMWAVGGVGMRIEIEPLPVNGSRAWRDLPRRLPDGSAAQ